MLKDLNNKVNQNEGGLLAGLWRNILFQNNYKQSLSYFINRYINETNTMGGRVKVEKRKTKSSLLKNIVAKEMTWKVFLDLLFNFLHIRKLTVTVKLEHSNGEPSIHSFTTTNVVTLNDALDQLGIDEFVTKEIKDKGAKNGNKRKQKDS